MPTQSTPDEQVAREEINLESVRGRARFRNLYEEGLLDDYYTFCDLETFLRTTVISPLRYGHDRIYVSSTEPHNFWLLHGREFYGFDDDPLLWASSPDWRRNLLEGQFPSAVLLTNLKGTTDRNKEFWALVLVNADEGSARPPLSMVSSLTGMDMPLVSFGCLIQLYDDENKVMRMLSKGELRLLDFTLEECVPLTAKEEKALKKEGGLHNLTPKLGFTLILSTSEPYWHRSGTCLFADKKNSHFLLGQDEGTYFGVQLPIPVQTITEAFESLTPPEARHTMVKRQGEWFMIPVDQKAVPETKDCVLQFSSDCFDTGQVVWLPLDNVESNKHYLVTEDGRVGKDGRIYARYPTLNHEDHNSIVGHGWYFFVRNTAIRSVTQQGVD